ncbi:ribose-5-phosphate isomerase RpiA [Polycladidibacter hongkongensis]|uniref:ribose-5-phosphate isomerase RpiA n=1 Tax=Polycladidibacter hongkongensis TaxID=1647556 RepID=UPI00082E3ABB|nr:ribose-5-phosphate isomerase RpiA [Pseudovibrio hongkongensis]
MSQSLKVKAAAAALEEVQNGAKLGIGTGSTANEMIRLLAKKVEAGFEVIGVPTSKASEALCRELGVPLTTLEETPQLDLTIDGADELDAQLSLVKGGGGALLREKLVAAASKKMVVIADGSKVVEHLGKFPLPIEVQQFGLNATKVALQDHFAKNGVAGELVLRGAADAPFITDNGNYILDAHLDKILNPPALACGLNDIPGVVEHGLFIGLASTAYVAQEGDILKMEA